MSDWKWLNKARIPRGKSKFGSSPADGFNGVFHFKINNVPLLVMGSEDDQWEHISVSVAGSKSTPSFSQMRQVKELFRLPSSVAPDQGRSQHPDPFESDQEG
jgi:hypothetical protein